jgi:iron complex outermembrane receptor protein
MASAVPPCSAATSEEIMSLSLEDLIDIEVTSAARMPQKLNKAAAAIYVLTAEDIARSGATSIPEALRLVPGMQVAQIDSNKWAITCRGFNEAFSNKMLVMIDGRTVYTPMFGGVFWDVQDVMLEDIERIEVIRGPGGTLWGANSVNGVINVITKRAKKTQGLLFAAAAGSEEKGAARLRYGGSLGDKGFYRFYVKAFERDTGVGLEGLDAADDWSSVRGGFKGEWGDEEEQLITLQGDIYTGSSGTIRYISLLESPYSENAVGDSEVTGENILFRLQNNHSETASSSLQLYYDGTDRQDIFLSEKRDTFDIDFQNQFVVGERHNLVWGLGYRYTQDSFGSSFVVSGDPESRSDELYSVFVQDNVSLIEDRLSFIAGTKLEHNDYTGIELQPSARLVWTPSITYTLWGSVSRAVRTPTRFDSDSIINFGVTAIEDPVYNAMGYTTAYVSYTGFEDIDSEDLIAYELGVRYTPNSRTNFDISLFYNDYDSLIVDEFQERIFSAPYVVDIYTKTNLGSGKTYGAEIAIDYQPLNNWQIKSSYSLLRLGLDEEVDSFEGKSPQHQVSIMSTWKLNKRTELNASWRYVDELPELDIPSYHTLGLRLAHQLTDSLELAVVGQNLLDDVHREFFSTMAVSTGIERSVYVQLTGHFR